MTERFKDIAGATVVLLVLIVTVFVSPLCSRRVRPPYLWDINNLKQIGILCRLYAMDHEGRYPNDWAEFISHEAANSEIFVTLNNREAAGDLTNVMEWTDYVYIPGRTEASPPDAVVAFLPPGHHIRKGRSRAIVLFVDEHVERMSIADFTRAMNKNPNKGFQATLDSAPEG